MAIATPNTLAAVDPCFMRPTERCFFCGKPLSGGQWIYWNGNDESGQQIWLHPPCAQFLADNLEFDFHAHAKNS